MTRSILILLATLLPLLAVGAPVADEDRVPIDLRRTTLVVRDIDASLAFYRDALGMEVIYDQRIRTPRDAPSDDDCDKIGNQQSIQGQEPLEVKSFALNLLVEVADANIDDGLWIELRESIAAHHEQVFACLSTASGLTRWFPRGLPHD